MKQLVFILITVMLAACSDPIVMIPGSSLSGEVKSKPEVWASVPGTIQLETRPTDPYSVNIWTVTIGADLYVATRTAKWMNYIEADPAVRIRIHSDVYELKAHIVDDAAEMQRLAKQYHKIHDVDETESWLDDATAYRLDRR